MLTRPVLRLTLTAVPWGATQSVPAAGEGTGAAACPPLLSPAAPWPPACEAVRRTATHSVAHIRHKLFSCIRPPRQVVFFPTVATRLMRLGHCLVSAPRRRGLAPYLPPVPLRCQPGKSLLRSSKSVYLPN